MNFLHTGTSNYSPSANEIKKQSFIPENGINSVG